MAEYINREVLRKVLSHELVDADTGTPMDFYNMGIRTLRRMIEDIPAADVHPVVRCKDCKHFHLDYFGEVNGVNIIVAHEICDLWAGGCRTMRNAFCSNGVRKDGK